MHPPDIPNLCVWGDSFRMSSWPRWPDIWFTFILDVYKDEFGLFYFIFLRMSLKFKLLDLV